MYMTWNMVYCKKISWKNENKIQNKYKFNWKVEIGMAINLIIFILSLFGSCHISVTSIHRYNETGMQWSWLCLYVIFIKRKQHPVMTYLPDARRAIIDLSLAIKNCFFGLKRFLRKAKNIFIFSWSAIKSNNFLNFFVRFLTCTLSQRDNLGSILIWIN